MDSGAPSGRAESLTPWLLIMIMAPTMSARRVTVMVVLAVWVLLGPVAMAFDGCTLMGAMCESPCAAMSWIAVPSPSGFTPVEVVNAVWLPQVDVVGITADPAEPPPKSSLQRF